MKIALYDIDSKIPNLALMKLSAWHKKQGDEVELYWPLKKYDKVYASQIFTWSKPQYHYDEIGGSGTKDWSKVLPKKVEHIYPDYSLYNCEYAMGFATRGCIRNCPFCIVPQKEGLIRLNTDIYEFWSGQKKLVLLDNNILALPRHFQLICKQIRKEKIKVDFNQGLDHRLLTQEVIDELKSMSHTEYRFSFDHPSYLPTVERAINLLQKNGIKRSMWFVLVGFNTTFEEDLQRLNYLRQRDQDAYVQRYHTCYHQKPYILLARWVNQHHIFRTHTLEEFKAKQ